MANDFSGDPDCVALWKLENNADDDIGGNDLTEVNSPAYSSSDKKEGSYSIDLEKGSVQYCSIADGDLDAGFPGKSGTSEQSFSICGWFKGESLSANGGLVNKLTSAGDAYRVYIGSDAIVRFAVGYSGGVTTLDFGAACDIAKWYHFGVTFDASTNAIKIRVWDDDAGSLLDSNATDTVGGNMTPCDNPLEIGRVAESDSYTFDGLIDEVVIFKDVLTDDEIDQIRAGAYGSSVTEKSSADSGSGADAVEALVTETDKSSADAGSGAEGATDQSAVLAGTEGGSGLEALISRLLAAAESGSAGEEADLDTQEPPRELSASEEAEGADRLVAKIEMPAKGGGMKLWI